MANLSALETLAGRRPGVAQEIDPYFVWKEESRPDIPHNVFDFEIPSIDLAPAVKLAKLRAEIAASPERRGSLEEEISACTASTAAVEQEIRAACESYGFFRIFNHGFPKILLDELENIGREIFDFPLEVKNRIEEALPSRLSRVEYQAMKRNSAFARTYSGNIWNEAFEYYVPESVQAGTIEKFSSILWPGEPDNSGTGLAFRSTAEAFGKESSKLAEMLLNLMASALGLPQESVYSLLNCEPGTQIGMRIRINHYPVCVQPDLTWGVHGHTDPSLITWLHQDAVGGLQICFKDGTWHGVRPIPDSLVINVGDYMQAWTNGRFISAEHQVVANEKSPRISIANFVNSLDLVAPRPELVDAQHPLLYRPFTRGELKGILRKNGLSKDRNQILDHFRI